MFSSFDLGIAEQQKYKVYLWMFQMCPISLNPKGCQ